MRKSILAAAIAALTAPAAFAGSITSTADINLAGGITGGYFYSTNTGSGTNAEYQVSDFLVELSGEATKGVGFVGAFGTMAAVTVLDGGVGSAPVYPFDFQYGWLSVAANEKLTIDAGMLATNVGYEVAPSYDNAYASLGALWIAQPAFYPGVRASYDAGDLSFYAEASGDSAGGTLGSASAAWAAGLNGSAASVDYAVSYFNYNGYKGLLDVIVSSKLGGIPVAANFDFHILKEPTVAGGDDNAFGFALYATPTFDKVDVPVRLEYLSDGNSGIYGMDSGFTFTVTPTYKFSDNTFVRAEMSFVSSDNKIFVNDSGGAQDNKTSFAVQAGFTF